MTDIIRQRLLPYKPRFLFALAADIERYPEFLPACEGVQILSRPAPGEVIARMEIVYKVLAESWVSRVRFDEKAMTIRFAQEEGVFSLLHGEWKFTARGSGAVARINMHVSFGNPMLSMTFQPLLDYGVDKIIASFEERASELSAG